MSKHTLLPKFQTNLDSIVEKMNSKPEGTVFVFNTPFFKFKGTRQNWDTVKADFRKRLVEYLARQGFDAQLRQPKEKRRKPTIESAKP